MKDNPDSISKLVLVQKKSYEESEWRHNPSNGKLNQGKVFHEETHFFTSNRKLDTYLKRLKLDQKKSVNNGVPAYCYSVKIKDLPLDVLKSYMN